MRRLLSFGLFGLSLIACSGKEDDAAPGAADPPVIPVGPGTAAATTGAVGTPAQGAAQPPAAPAAPAQGGAGTVLKPDPAVLPSASASSSGAAPALPPGFPTALPSGFPTALPPGFPTALPSGMVVPTSIPIPTFAPPTPTK